MSHLFYKTHLTPTCRYVKENVWFTKCPWNSIASRLCTWVADQLLSMVMRAVIPIAARAACSLLCVSVWTICLEEHKIILTSLHSFSSTHPVQGGGTVPESSRETITDMGRTCKLSGHGGTEPRPSRCHSRCEAAVLTSTLPCCWYFTDIFIAVNYRVWF